MKRELHIRPARLFGHMTVTMEGDPRELAGDIFHGMQHNRVLAETMMTAVALYIKANGIDPLEIPAKVKMIDNMRIFTPPTETQPGSDGKQPGEG
jgi:hypothetical protein